jgi:hypothetical protein
MVRPLVLASFLLASAGASAAAQSIVTTVRGVVRDSTGAPISGAEVIIGRRSAATGATGTFVVDSISPGRYTLTVRMVGMTPVRELLQVPATGLAGLEYRLRTAGTILPTVVVQAERPGIFGTVVLLGNRPAPGARVQLVGAEGRVAMADSSGQFSFQELRQGSYMVWVTHPGFTERRISVLLGRNQGRDLAINLLPSTRVVSRGDIVAMDDLTKRLSFGLERERMTRDDLQKRGKNNICDLPQLRPVTGLGDATIILILNGTTVYRDVRAYSLCAWSADEVEMVEFARGPCEDRTGTVADLLGIFCGSGAGRRIAPPTSIRGGLSGAAARRQTGGGYVIIWERR